MLPRIYVDTNVYLDLLTPDRRNRLCNFADLASLVFDQVKSGQYLLVISDWVIEEFKKYADARIITDFITHFEKEQTITIIRTNEDEANAHKLSLTNYPDALHVVLAKKNNCLYLVTRDMHMFEFKDLIEICLPGDL